MRPSTSSTTWFPNWRSCDPRPPESRLCAVLDQARRRRGRAGGTREPRGTRPRAGRRARDRGLTEPTQQRHHELEARTLGLIGGPGAARR
jgi:hypothetical protein